MNSTAEHDEKIYSPDQLRDYLRAVNPGRWIVLIAVILLILGFVAWTIFGTMKSKLTAPIVVSNGVGTIYVTEDQYYTLYESTLDELTVEADDWVGRVYSMSHDPINAGELSEYAMELGGLSEGQYVFPVYAIIPAEDGTYSAKVTYDDLAPAEYLAG